MAIIKLQPYTIDETKNFTFNNVTATGDIFASNANLGNLVTANFFTGTLTTNAQPNITSLGTLSSLSLGVNSNANFSGTAYFGNANSVKITGGANGYVLSTDGTGNLDWVAQSGGGSTANIQILDEGNILTNSVSSINFVGSGVTASNTGNAVTVTISGGESSSSISNGNSNVIVQANSNVNVSVDGISNVLVVTSSGAIITGNLNSSNANLGNTATANYFTGTLTTEAQPNITSVGTLTGLNVNGNITAANITANTGVFTGNGSGLSAIAGANVTGTVANATFATTAGTVSTNAQPNITSIGTLTSLDITGNVTGGNANLGNLVVANFFSGDGSLLTGITANAANSNYANFAGTIVTAAQPNITSVGTLTSLNVNGTVTAVAFTANTGVFTGNGSGLSAIAGANVTGTVANATFATSAGSTTTAGTVTTNAQPNITSVGTLTSLDVTGNVSGNYFIGNGSLLTGVPANTSLINGNSNVVVTLNGNVTVSVSGTANSVVVTSTGINSAGYVNAVGNINGANITGTHYGAATGLTGIPGANVTGTVANATFATTSGTAGTVTTNAQPNITSTGTLSNLAVNGNVVIGGGSGGNISNANVISANTFIGNGSQLTGVIAVTAGTVTTNAQPNITSVGTLTSLGVSGTITAANITANTGVFTGNGSGLSSLPFGNISNFSNASLTVDELYSQGITRLDVTASGASGYLFDQYGATLNPALYVSSGQTLVFLLSVSGHPFLIQDSSSANYSTGLIHVTSNGTVTTSASAQGQVAGTLYWKVPYGITGNYKYQCSVHGGMNGNIVIADANVSNHSVSTAATVTTNAQPNITSVGTLTDLTVGSGNLTANTGNVIFGNVGNVKITGGTANYVLSTDGTGNLNWVSQSGGGSANIQILDEGTILTNSVSSINFTGDGVIASNTGNAVTVNITSGGGGGSSISNGTSNVSIATANGNITMSVGGVSNVFVASQIGISVSGISNLGNVGNVRITGGVANYVLSTDGAGILNWVAQSGGGGSANIQILDEGNILTNSVSSINFVGPGVVANTTGNAVTVTISGGGSAVDAITLDSFTGNGVQTNFTLSVTPQSENFTSINIGGVSQLKTGYSLSGNTIIFSEAPAAGASIEVTTTTLASASSTGFVTRTYTGNGVQNTFAVTSGVTDNSILVMENGIVQVPVTDYSVSGANLIFATAPASNMAIQVRELNSGNSGGGGGGITAQDLLSPFLLMGA